MQQGVWGWSTNSVRDVWGGGGGGGARSSERNVIVFAEQGSGKR